MMRVLLLPGTGDAPRTARGLGEAGVYSLDRDGRIAGVAP
jgi:hypothetical protein